jgi:F-type H+-transporting ATPase subunit b
VAEAIYQSFVSIGWWEIVVTICNTLITFLIVKKFLYGPVKNMIVTRETELKDMKKQAKADRKAAADMRKEYNEKIKGAQKEAAEIIHNATQNAATRSDEILADASRQASRVMQKAEEDIQRERRKAVNEIKDEVAGLSVMIASKVVEKEIKEDDHKRMIDEFISKVG